METEIDRPELTFQSINLYIMEATAKDLRFHSKELLDAVKRGEEVVITYRGTPCAKLVPIAHGVSQGEDAELFGIWGDHDETESVQDFVDKARERRG